MTTGIMDEFAKFLSFGEKITYRQLYVFTSGNLRNRYEIEIYINIYHVQFWNDNCCEVRFK